MDLLDRLLGHDSWTTRQLLDLAGTLSDQQLDQEFDIGHRTVRRTLEHIVWNIECWTDLMKGGGVRSRPAANQSVAMLSQRYETASAELLQFDREIVDQSRLDDTFLDTLDDPPTERSFGGVIVHLATHGMHHRAQLLFMLRRLGVECLPEGDALSWEQSVRTRRETEIPRTMNAVDLGSADQEAAFLDEARQQLAKAAGKIRHCLNQLTDDQVWWRPTEPQNSIANIILHLCGNVRQWIISGLGGEPDVRNRPQEFAERGPISKQELVQRLDDVLGQADAVLRTVSTKQLLESRRIQGFETTVLAAVFDTVAHFKGHTQEIICLTRTQLGDRYHFDWVPPTPEQGAP